MKGQSDTIPERLVEGPGKTHYNFNIEQIEIEDPDGNPKNIYTYDYVVIKGKLTKAKIIRALKDSKLDIDEEIEPSEIESVYNAAKESINLAGLSNLTYSQLDTHIDNNVTDLKSTKVFLKKLSKVVLALLKYHNVK